MIVMQVYDYAMWSRLIISFICMVLHATLKYLQRSIHK